MKANRSFEQPRETAGERRGDWVGMEGTVRANPVISWEVNSITTGNSQGETGPIKGSHTATKENVM